MQTGSQVRLEMPSALSRIYDFKKKKKEEKKRKDTYETNFAICHQTHRAEQQK